MTTDELIQSLLKCARELISMDLTDKHFPMAIKRTRAALLLTKMMMKAGGGSIKTKAVEFNAELTEIELILDSQIRSMSDEPVDEDNRLFTLQRQRSREISNICGVMLSLARNAVGGTLPIKIKTFSAARSPVAVS